MNNVLQVLQFIENEEEFFGSNIGPGFKPETLDFRDFLDFIACRALKDGRSTTDICSAFIHEAFRILAGSVADKESADDLLAAADKGMRSANHAYAIYKLKIEDRRKLIDKERAEGRERHRLKLSGNFDPSQPRVLN